MKRKLKFGLQIGNVKPILITLINVCSNCFNKKSKKGLLINGAIFAQKVKEHAKSFELGEKICSLKNVSLCP